MSPSYEFTLALSWLYAHQHPNLYEDNMKIVHLSHPLGDGDGFATRVQRLVSRIVPLLLEGHIVILTGGFRGYTHHQIGFPSLFESFGSVPMNTTTIQPSSWEQFPPEHLCNKSFDWWFGVVSYYFLRPTMEISSYIQTIRSKLPDKYIGVHIRRGDHNYGLSIPIQTYIQTIQSYSFDVVFLATDNAESIQDCEYIIHKSIIYQPNCKSIGVSYPGQSTSNYLITHETETWVVDIAKEVLCDILLLSECTILIGLHSSQVTNIARLIGLSMGNILETILM